MTQHQRYNIEVDVEPAYMDDESEPDEERFVFSYTVTIRNMGDVSARLISRHWIITDANGDEREVHGEGVVGEQPHLEPGKGFRYTSGAMLETPIGSMHGTYELLADDGVTFTAEIPPFTLAGPRTLH
ncbi:Co2+/Mg2+ efflux protein ApaG [Aquisalimonas sp.]|uniref:Co2+/Mg2+ efflux protein ApaG n=1 Tax=Aquisalimonas sp. TaxID=1872621 RepID=UPI0025BC83A0|nr:Co2+/Mg2+ efflux protein ApaG [Aquisalimonas sp.]